ncbi:type I methionyl aminopeptidase [Patescibacteria group bacterium]
MDQNKIKAMTEGGKRLAEVKRQILEYSQTETSTKAIDDKAEYLIKKIDGEPSFKMVPGYSWSSCININDSIVHGIPGEDLKEGDLVTIDMGFYFKGFHTDSAMSFVVGDKDEKKKRFIAAGKKVLKKTISQAKKGKTIRDLSKTMQKGIESAGYSAVRELTGHGVGRELHMPPSIPCFVSNSSDMSIKMEPGMTLAIEVMYAEGDWPLSVDSDGWTMRTKDGKLSAVVEETVLVTDSRPIALTAL